MDVDYDVIIVGARVAGSSLAILLGRQGQRVLLVDRDRFPSDTLSTHFLRPPAVGMLAQLGVLADVEASGLRRMTRQRTYVGDCLFEGRMQVQEPAPAYGLCPRRDRLDWILIQHAQAHASVEFRAQTPVAGLLWEESADAPGGSRAAGVLLRGRDGRHQTIRAHAVVGADGKYSKIARWVGAAHYEVAPAVRPMYYAYYRGVAPLAEPASELFFHDGHIGYLMPMEPDLDCLVLDIQADEFEQFRADPPAQFDVAIRRLPGMAARLETARREGPVYGTRGVDNYMRVPSGPGWVLTGDAGVCKDPSTGTGIMDAFTQSFLLAEALGATLDGAGWETTMADYHRRRDAAVSSSYRSALAFAQEGEVPAQSLGWLQGVLASPGLVRLLAKSFPAAARTPDVFPPGVLRSLERTVGVSADALSTSLRQRRAA